MSAPVFEPLSVIRARPLIIEKTNVDTDQIMPARFLTTTTREGLGEKAFYDWRYDDSGALIEDAALNLAKPADRRILVGGKNFGCGSSREHAPWGLYDYGVRVVLAEAIADIFKNNCLKNGIAAIDISAEFYARIRANGDSEVCVDLEKKEIVLADGAVETFEMDDLYRQCLISGEDQLGLLLGADGEIAAYEQAQGIGA